MSLFIGGPWDGRKMHVPQHRNDYEVIEGSRFSLREMQRGYAVPRELRKVRYLKRALTRETFVWVPDNWTNEQLLNHLVRRYEAVAEAERHV